MKFGKVDNPEKVEFNLPPTHQQSNKILYKSKGVGLKEVFIGCAKWNRKDLKNFYPRGTKDDLNYYSSQFNAIELNASFYRMYPEDQFRSWHSRTQQGFKFFPKVPRLISHIKRLNETERLTDDFVTNILPLDDKLGMVFMQLREDFGPKNFDRLKAFIEHWPVEIPLAVEFRHEAWINDPQVADEVNELMEVYNITHIITDTPGKREMLHMRLTTSSAFIRYNTSNHKSDRYRLDEWLDRLKEWCENGLENIYFFVHEVQEEDTSLLSAYFIEQFNERFNTELKIPKTLK